jgi:hypothetical protein
MDCIGMAKVQHLERWENQQGSCRKGQSVEWLRTGGDMPVEICRWRYAGGDINDGKHAYG